MIDLYNNSVNQLTTEQQSAFNNLKKQVANYVLNDFVPDPILYNTFRSGKPRLYYRLTVPTGISIIIPYVDDNTPAVTNPLLQPAVSADNIRVRLEQMNPKPAFPYIYGYDAVAAFNDFQAPDLSKLLGFSTGV